MIADYVWCVCAVQYKLGRGNRDKVQQFMTITGARYGCLIDVEIGTNYCGHWQGS